MTAHDRDKIIALLKSIAAPCDDEKDWQCRHCLAAEELGWEDSRQLLAEFLAELAPLPRWQDIRRIRDEIREAQAHVYQEYGPKSPRGHDYKHWADVLDSALPAPPQDERRNP